MGRRMAASGGLGAQITGGERSSRRELPGPRWPWLWALAIAGGVVLFLIHPGALTDDSYAFLDWGRDLTHHYLPLLEKRTFQPLPILVGAVLSLFGSSAPTATMIFTLATLVLSGVAAWRVTELLGAPQPAPLLALVLAMGLMPMPLIADIAYNNAPYTTTVLWALVFELEGRRGWAWGMLIVAGLTRPEAWLFLLAYGAYDWWRLGKPFSPRRVIPILALAVGPILLWVLLEGLLFGNFFYSEDVTSGSAVATAHRGWAGIKQTLDYEIALAIWIFAAIGAAAIIGLRQFRQGLKLLALLVLSAVGIAVLAKSNFNLPSRDFSLLNSTIGICAAFGTAVPGLLLRERGGARAAVFAVGLAMAALLVAFSLEHTLIRVRPAMKSVAFSRNTEQIFNRDVGSVAHLIDNSNAHAHTIAMIGAVDNSQLAWVFDVPFNVITDAQEPQTKVIVEPTPLTWGELRKAKLTNRERRPVPSNWQRLLLTKHWEVWAAPGSLPVQLNGQQVPPPSG